MIKRVLLELGCEDKSAPGKLSSARVLAYLWGFVGALVAVALVFTGGPQHYLLVAELLAASLTAVGLRSRAKGE